MAEVYLEQVYHMNPLHGVESEGVADPRYGFQGLPNPLHGVESWSVASRVEEVIEEVLMNPLHGVERFPPRAP